MGLHVEGVGSGQDLHSVASVTLLRDRKGSRSRGELIRGW